MEVTTERSESPVCQELYFDFIKGARQGLRRSLASIKAASTVSWESDQSDQDMPNLPASEYLEIRDGKVCVAGTRIGLDVLVYDFRRGETPEGILQAYPSIGSLAKVYGAITFVLEHPQAIESYLQEQEALWNKFREEHPIPDEMLERLRRTREELSRRSA